MFRFPAGFAAEVSMSATGEASARLESKSGEKAMFAAAFRSGRVSSRDAGRLALASIDIHQIVKMVESSRGWRPALNRDFVEPKTDTHRQLAGIWQRLLRVERVGIHDNYFDLGGDSLHAVRLFSEIHKSTGKQFPLATLIEAPTIESLARVVELNGWRPLWQSLVPIKASGSKPPFYCVHGVGGNVLEYLDLAKHMDDDQPFYGIQAIGLDGKQPNVTVEEMAAHYIQEVTAFQPRGPYYVGGSSFGGLVAYEMARQLCKQGERVALLALFDTNGPGYRKALSTTTAWERRFNRFRQRVSLHWGNFTATERGQRSQYVREKAKRWKNQMVQANTERAKRLHASLRFAINRRLWTKEIRDVNRAGHWAAGDYVPKEYAGSVTLFRATEQPRGIMPDRTLGWGRLVKGDLHICDTPGYHGAIVREPRSKVLAAQLNEKLRAAQGDEVSAPAPDIAEERRTQAPTGTERSYASTFSSGVDVGMRLPEV